MYPLPANHKTKEGLRFLSADEINTIEKMLNNLRIDVDAQLDHAEIIPPNQDGDGWVFRIPAGGSGGLDLSKASLGCKVNPNGNDPDLARIYAGTIDRIAVAQTDLTVANNDYAYVRRTIADDTMLVTNAASVPADDATYKYYRLYRFTVTTGTASIQNYYRPFDIEGGLPSTATQYQVLAWNGTAWAADWARWV